MRENQHVSRKCYVDNIQANGLPPVMTLDAKFPRGQIKSLDITKKFFVAKGREFGVGACLKSVENEELVRYFASNLDVFA